MKWYFKKLFNKTETQDNKNEHSFSSCSTTSNKAFLFVFLSLVSLVAAIAVDYICYLFVGRTSLGTWYNPYWIGFFFLCGIIAAAFFVFRHDIRTKPENLFLVIALSITCFSSISFDVNNPSWDSGAHYRHVVERSKFRSEVDLTVSDTEMINANPSNIYFNLSDLNSYAKKLDQENAIEDGGSVYGSVSYLYQSVASLPGSLVFSICTALDAPFSLKFILSRLPYALIYSLVAFFGMKQLKSGKMLFAVIALLPTAVFLASNYNYDYWVNAFMLLAGACLVRELQTPEEKISKTRAAVLLGSFIIGFGPKAIYFPLILLCLLIPKRKFSSALSSRLFRGGVFFSCFLVAASFLIPYFLVNGPGVGDIRGGSDVNATEQIRYVLSHPIDFSRTMGLFLLDYYSISLSAAYITFYAYLGFSSLPLWTIVFSLLVFTTITDKSNVDTLVCTWKSRVFSILLHLFTVVLFASALYVEFSGVGSESISGCQPRYLIPLLFCTLVFLSSSRFAWPRTLNRRKTMYNTIVLGLMSMVLLVGFWQVYISLLY